METVVNSGESLNKAADFLKAAKRIGVLTGAGISAESGVATFRGAGGLWEGHNILDVASPEGFTRDPALVWRFYNARRANLASIKPNPGHHALVELENHFGEGNFTLITQNVDGLHRDAGSRRMHELHGNLRVICCSHCDFQEDRGTDPQADLPTCEKCGQLLRPGVVWFGEMLPLMELDAAEEAARTSDCFLVVGTSAVVWPAAGLIPLAKKHGARIIEINLESTEASSLVDVSLLGPSGIILPQLMKLITSK